MTKTRDLANLANGITSANIVDGAITNADVNNTAGIVSSKLNFTQAGSGAVQRTVESKLQDVVSVKDFGAVGDGVTDDTAAIQAAIDLWVSTERNIIFPRGTYKITQPLVATFTTNSTSKKLITGYGASIDASTVTGNALTFTITGALTLVRNLVIEGLQISGNTTANAALVMQGPLAGNSYLYNCVLRDLTLDGYSGLSLLGNFFESSVENCNISCPIGTASAGYPIYIETAGGSGSGSGGIVSSLTLYQNNTRGGINGIRSRADVSDVNIINGTYLLAWNEGILVQNAQQGYIKGAHVEACQESKASDANGQAGIKVEVTKNYSVSDVTALKSGSFMTNAVFAFVGADSNVIIQGVSSYGITTDIALQGASSTTAAATLIGNMSSTVIGSISVTEIDGFRVKPVIKSSRVSQVSGSASYTPSVANQVLNVALAQNPTINAPSFTPQEGDELEFMFEQAGGGSNTVNWNSVYLPGSFVPTAVYGKISTIKFRYSRKFTSSNNLFWIVIATATT